MKVVATKAIKPGNSLGKTIYNENGQVLLNAGVTLTANLIQRLQDYSITYVHIEDPHTSDIVSQYPISQELRARAIRSIRESFGKVKSNNMGFVSDKVRVEMTDMVRSIIEELQNHKDVISLLSDVFTYDDYVFTHSLNVTMYALALGTELQLPAKKLEDLGLGAILHDVGKMAVPKEVLLKPGKLTKEEFLLIKTHAEAGFEMLRKNSNIPLIAAHCAFQHHERLDGSGYPRGIEGNDIHLFGKILAIADVFDAVTSNRVYRAAMLPHEGLEILYSGAGTLFDQEMVEAFRRCVAVYPNGLSVTLNDGRKGIVAKQNSHLCDRPVVRIFEEDGQRVEKVYEVDLASQLNLVISDCDTISIS